jgi:hypothetical protein
MIKRLLVLPVVAAMGLAAVVAYGAWNGGGEHTTTSASAVPSEGIDVHGNWHVSIYNQDGTLDREYAFENALQPTGSEVLGLLLTPTTPTTRLPGGWTLALGQVADPGLSPCNTGFGGAFVGQNAQLVRACFVSFGDQATPLTVEPLSNGLRLSGNVTALIDDSTIDYVESFAHVVNPQDGSYVAYAFTGTDVGPFENIAAGQIIQVQVDITFDTPAP